jgi:hypothetical protein
MFHLLAEGKAIYYNGAALVGHQVTGPAAVLSMGTIQILQFIMLGLGIFGSIFTAYKIAARDQGEGKTWKAFWPHLLVLLLFGLVNIWLFTMPMQHRV